MIKEKSMDITTLTMNHFSSNDKLLTNQVNFNSVTTVPTLWSEIH